MRPVDKGEAPTNYTRCQDAGPDLQARLGTYCSYCERQIETYLAVEHMQPKERCPSLRNEWHNFLLACVNCNSSKGNKCVALRDYFWPDRDNTLCAFNYRSGGIVEPSPTLRAVLRLRANDTLVLLGLDKVPGNPQREPTNSDKRWLRRKEIWQLAERCRQRLQTNNSPEVRELIVETAAARGMFSIWWSVFDGDVDMRRRLRDAFPGTDRASFDADENLVPRAGGQL